MKATLREELLNNANVTDSIEDSWHPIVMLFIWRGDPHPIAYWLVGYLFTVTVTDYIDGYLARRCMDGVTVMGKFTWIPWQISSSS